MALRLQAHVGLDGSGFEAGLHRLERVGHEAFGDLRNFALQAFGVIGAEAMFHKSIENAKELVNMARKMGTDGTEGFQILRQAAIDSSTEIETVAKAFEKINIARAKILRKDKGWEEMAAGFKGLGVSDITMSTQSMLQGPMRNAALGMNPAVFEPWFKMATQMKTGADIYKFVQTDFEELGEKMKKMGILIDSETAVKLKALGDHFDLLSQILVARVGPALLTFAEWLMRTGQKPLVGIAATAAAIGGGTASWSFRDLLKYIGFGPALFDYTPIKPFDKQAAKEAGVEVVSKFDEFIKSLDEMQKKLKDEADKLDNPTPTSFEDFTGKDGKDKPGAKGRIDSGDALTRVGNFLGDSQGGLVSLTEKSLLVLRGIERNTRAKSHIADNGSTDDATFPTA